MRALDVYTALFLKLEIESGDYHRGRLHWSEGIPTNYRPTCPHNVVRMVKRFNVIYNRSLVVRREPTTHHLNLRLINNATIWISRENIAIGRATRPYFMHIGIMTCAYAGLVQSPTCIDGAQDTDVERRGQWLIILNSRRPSGAFENQSTRKRLKAEHLV